MSTISQQRAGSKTDARYSEVRDRRRIAVPPREVWRLLGEIEWYPQWCAVTASVSDVERSAGLGTAYEARTRLGLVTIRARWRIVEWQPPVRQLHRSEGGGMPAALERRLEVVSDGEGGAVVTMAFRYRPRLGVLGRLVDRLVLRGALQRRIPASLEQVESLLCRPGPTAVP
ncbi:MAG: Polyketide cyclase / dehydrase and lipid transport [Baekduia sp.]|nr:Polyketide cyclase / dehydrase and lipid transport [Baekduia sp.]